MNFFLTLYSFLYTLYTFLDKDLWPDDGLVKTAETCSHLNYLLTPWCRVLLEKLTGLQLVKKLPTFHGTRRFINALTIVRHLSPSWASPIQSIYPHPTSWRFILILSTHLRLGLPSGLFPSDFPSKSLQLHLVKINHTRSSCAWFTGCPKKIVPF